MAWTRALSCGFELQAFEECDWSSTDKNTAANAFNTTTPNTGSYSYVASLSYAAGPGKTTGSVTQLRAGVWWRGAAVNAALNDGWVVKLTNTAGWVIGVKLLGSDDSTVDLVVNNDSKATTTIGTLGLDNASYKHIAIVASADASAGFVSFYVDGVRKLTWTGDTSTDLTGVFFMGATNDGNTHWNGTRLDDLYVDTGTGNADAAPPSIRFYPSIPGGAGASSDFTPTSGANYTNVDEAGAHDSDTTVVSTTTNGHKDYYATADVTPDTGYNINAAIVVAVARTTLAGPSLKLAMRSSGGTEAASDAIALPTSYGVLTNRFTTEPGGAAWTTAKFNGSQSGFEAVI